MTKEVLAVRRGKLFANGRTFGGFISREDAREVGLDRKFILANGEYFPKSELEHKPEYKQIVSYCVLLDDSGKVFTYQRGPKEPRLKDKWSIGIGGHVHYLDARWDMIKSNVIQRVHEELNLGMHVTGLRHLGYINCEDSSVNRDHLGMLYVQDVYDIDTIRPRKECERDLLNSSFITASQIEEIMKKHFENPEKNHELEEWSEIGYHVFLKEGRFKLK